MLRAGLWSTSWQLCAMTDCSLTSFPHQNAFKPQRKEAWKRDRLLARYPRFVLTLLMSHFSFFGSLNMILNHRRTFLLFASLAVVLLTLNPLRADSPQSAKQRPILDFVNAQGGFPPDVLFVPPVENFVGFFDPATGLFASVDYAGLADEAIMDITEGAVGFNTTFDGKVTERPLNDGRTEVHVTLQTTNALTWVFDAANFTGDFNAVPLEFGARIPEILMDGAEPALGDSQLSVKFIHGEPVGGDLPDLSQLLFEPTEDQQLLSLSFHSKTIGELANGTAGQATVQQRQIINPSQKFAETGDYFPVESVKLQPVGGP